MPENDLLLTSVDFHSWWWTVAGSNRWPLPCHGSALPAKLTARKQHIGGLPTCKRLYQQSPAYAGDLLCDAAHQPMSTSKFSHSEFSILAYTYQFTLVVLRSNYKMSGLSYREGGKKLIYFEKVKNKSEALRREDEIKKLPKKKNQN